MRQFSEGFAQHLAQGATTLCWCWRLVRRDGPVLGFTDHDRPLQFEGTDFAPATGLEAGETADRLGPQTQTSEVIGVLDSDAIGEDDIALARYDGAVVETWRVNWRAPEERALIRTDTIGEIVREDGAFRAELRSGQHAMNRVSGRVYQHVCDARLGDARCGVDIDSSAHRAEAMVTACEGARLTLTAIGVFADGWFTHGNVTWISGARAGIVDAVVAHAGAALTLARPVADWVVPGDTLVVRAGCDRTFATCRSKFDNGINFQGFPHVPGNDALMRYPDEDDALDGAPRIR